MVTTVLADTVISISDLKKNPMVAVAQGERPRLKEWKALDATIQKQFKKKLAVVCNLIEDLAYAWVAPESGKKHQLYKKI